MRFFIVFTAAMLFAVPAFTQTESVADQVRALDKQQREATIRGDYSLEDSRTADGYVAISGMGVFNREQIKQRVSSGDVKLQVIDVDEEQVHVYGNTAVITGRDHVRGTFKGQPFEQTSHYSRVWIKIDGAWKLVLFQETPVQQPAN